MANDNENMLDIDTTLELDDELCNLFSAFDEVSASDELKDATLARILATASDEGEAGEEATANTVTTEVKAVAGGKSGKSIRRAKWRAIRIGAIAACLALALTGGIAYATPAAYYEVEQDGTTITLGVNCFGITVQAASDSEVGTEIIESSDLSNRPYKESLERAIESMEERNPDKPVEYGPQGGEREVVQPEGGQREEAPPQGDPGSQGQDGQPQPQGGVQPEGSQPQPQAAGQPEEPGGANGSDVQAPNGPQGEGQGPGQGQEPGNGPQTGGNPPDRP